MGTWIKLAAPEVVEIVAIAGFDFVVIDLEHTMLNLETASTMIGMARLAGLSAFVRVPDHGHSVIQRVLDAGAAGVLVPQVDTADQARQIVRQSKFPPHGTRGLSPSARGGGWGSVPAAEYMHQGDRDCMIVVQLESEAAVRGALEIAAVPGIDGVFLGPGDLAASSGWDPASEPYQRLVTQLERDCADHGVVLGTACGSDAAAAERLLHRGYGMLVAGSDATILRAAASDLVRSVHSRAAPS